MEEIRQFIKDWWETIIVIIGATGWLTRLEMEVKSLKDKKKEDDEDDKENPPVLLNYCNLKHLGDENLRKANKEYLDAKFAAIEYLISKQDEMWGKRINELLKALGKG